VAERTREAEERRHEEVSVAGSLARCPYCHDEVAPGAGEWVACESCLARHHEACWNESGRCATCKGTRFLARADRSSRTSRKGHNRVLHAILGYLTLGMFPVIAAELALRRHLRQHTPSLARDLLPGRLRIGIPALLFVLGYALFFGAFAVSPVPPGGKLEDWQGYLIMAATQFLAVVPIVSYLHVFRETVRRHELAALPGSRDDERIAARWRDRKILDTAIAVAGLLPGVGFFGIFVASARVCGALALHSEHEDTPERPARPAPVKD
jgi:hypothetical protein